MKRALRLKLLFLALLCSVAQGAWAQNFDVWDGVSEEKPGTYGACIQIKSAAQMAWVMNHYTADVGKQNPYRASIDICTDIDMTAGIWKPLGSEEKLYYKPEPWVSSVTCNGLGHTVKIRIDNGTSDNYQGLFYGIGEDGKVKNLHVDCNIVVGNARFVGGICGENDGTIENCWVSGHIESSHYSQYDADLGGIAGLNDDGIIKYCCVTADVTNTGGNYGVGGIAGSNDGTIRHVTFTGSVSVNHSQDNKWVGDQDKTLEYNYDSFNQSEYDAASGYDTYCRILKYKGLPSITINNAGDWNEMAEYVNYGCTLSGSYVTLNNNISVSTMMGSSEDNSFQGTFDGDGHTLTLNVSNQARFASPFKYVKGATIKNLKTAGSISGTGNADGKLLAGIVGHCMGNTTITNCVSSMALTTDYDNDAAMAGLVAATRGGSLTISGCVFNGSMAGGANSGRCAGISGYEYIATTTSITNTLFAPTSLTVPVDEYTRTFTRDADATITNCYYTQTLGTAQGTQTIALTTAPGNLGNLVKDYGMVKAYENGILFDGKYYAFTLSGTGTDANPYIIGNAGQWDDFANYVTNGINLSGKFVKLTSDISVSTMAGSDDADSFQGNFDGDGHTLTVNYNTSEPWTAPFRHVKNAVIRNLTVAGTITTSAQFAAGFVGESHGSLSLTGCRSSVAINSSVQGDGTHGGLVSTLSGKDNAITIEGCVFDGSFATTSGTTNCGGFIGWPVYNTSTITHSLMAPVSVAEGMLINTFSRWHTTYSPNITRSYFVPTDNLPADQGTSAHVYTEEPHNLGSLEKDYGVMKVYSNGILFEGKYYLNSGMGLPGSGTEEDPYTIGSAEEWDIFVLDTDKNSYYYAGEFVKLIRDISVTTMVKRFHGTFDGDGHTLTVNIAENNILTRDIAPFRLLENATIKNLRTAGSVTATDWAFPLAGVVGRVDGNATIENCSSSVAISADSPLLVRAGGIVASVALGNATESTVHIIGCAFTGSITYSDSRGHGGAGIIGMINKTGPYEPHVYISHCLFAPSAFSIGKPDFNAIANGDSASYYTITDCYYTETGCIAQGTKAVALAAAPGKIGDLVKDYGMVKAYQNGLFFDGKYYVNADLGLSDNTDNGSAISEYNGATVDVTLTGCTFYKDGAWNTICLPFNLTLAGSPLDGAVARPLTGASISGSTLNLTFGDAATELKAGTPYIIKWASGDNIVNPKFDGVTIDATDRSFDNGAKGDERVRFIGVYKSIAFDGEDKSVLLLGGANTLYHPVSGAGVGALRAYFKIGDSATKATISVKGSVLMVK